MKARRWRTLIVEDEPLARERLLRLVAMRPDFEVALSCCDGHAATRALANGDFDVALVDIQMPGPGGMTLLRAAHAAVRPAVILVTAHAEFALEAFTERAVDYLLKPFDQARLNQALDAARDRLLGTEAMVVNARLYDVINGDTVQPQSPHRRVEKSNRLLAGGNGRWRIVQFHQIDWIEAAGRTCVLHCGTSHHEIRRTFAYLADLLEPHHFVQVSRCVLLNVARVLDIHELFKGDAVAVLHDQTEIPISRRFKAAVLHRLDSSARDATS